MTLVGAFQLNHVYAMSVQREEFESMSIVPFYWMIMIIGGIIIITLTYVSWRKYIGDKKNKLKRNANN